MNEHAARAYGNQQVNTASPAKMVFMLYEKCISSLNEAVRAIESGNIEARCNANCKAQELIAHLSNTLDMKAGGQIAQNLEELFNFSMLHLMEVDRNNDPKPAHDVIRLLSPIRDSWAQLAERSEGELRQAAELARPQGSIISKPNSEKSEAETTPQHKSGLSISA
ncbi:flagellar export chaperone FliS [Thalassospiraceae bacterium SW-3-3]|nr:flagellar export chaperone FliS [Thalassospiraceae bacterium SW-3-3]